MTEKLENIGPIEADSEAVKKVKETLEKIKLMEKEVLEILQKTITSGDIVDINTTENEVTFTVNANGKIIEDKFSLLSGELISKKIN